MMDDTQKEPAAKALLLVAENPSALSAQLRQWRDRLASDDPRAAELAFAELSATSGLRPVASDCARLGFVAGSAEEALHLIESALKRFDSDADAEAWTTPSGVAFRRQGADVAGTLVALFPGQGSQYVNMACDIREEFPQLADALATADRLFAADGKPPLSELIYPPQAADEDAASRELQKTENAQPAIGAVSLGYYAILHDAGFSADLVAGHSFGELTALWAAGVLAEEDFLALAKRRGEAMSPPDDPAFDAGSMMAVIGDVEKVAEDIVELEDVTIANYNSKDQVVLAGPTARIDEAFLALKEKGYRRVVKLPVAAACHTPMVGHAQAPFAEALASVEFSAPRIPVFSNGTGKPHSADPDAIKVAMQRHMLESVRFREEVEALYEAGGRIFVEFGPRNALTKFVENILAEKDDVIAIAVNPAPKKEAAPQLLQAAVQLAVAGVSLSGL